MKITKYPNLQKLLSSLDDLQAVVQSYVETGKDIPYFMLVTGLSEDGSRYHLTQTASTNQSWRVLHSILECQAHELKSTIMSASFHRTSAESVNNNAKDKITSTVQSILDGLKKGSSH